MNKVLKGFVSCILASFLMLFMVCFKPIISHAEVQYQEVTSDYYRRSYVGYTGAHTARSGFSDFGSVVYRYTGMEAGTSESPCLKLVYMDNTWTELAEIHPAYGFNNCLNNAEAYASFDFTVNGIHYVGNNIPLQNDGHSNFTTALDATQYIVPAGNDNSSAVTDTSGDDVTNPPVVPPNNSDDGTDFVKLMYQNINNTVNEIGLAAQGLNADGSANPTKTVFYSAPSVNASIIKAVMNAKGVTFFVTYEYEGYVFCSAITPELAAVMFREDIVWYGPAYIATYCPTVMIGAVV